ncbi:ribosomal protein S18 acetylase RimI-like enzyme [Kaistia hirudinis]|uniref:Ribosomal protein S18 acetylase RimI-like enzyme n=1 Tax=Kaistia hirudinis TaxID=1293440 RepID=A0A840AT75_9HYPH|nr:GNAT family N-acetyltransferase [Kaistia hirudinis]MBB3932011.1 ribosomal protein S18 acetylase RimI-like enzyme [Kaistia hirudinis]
MASGPDLIIRQLGVADAEAYRAVRLRGLRDVPTAFTQSFEEESAWPIERFERRLGSPPSAIFGAELSGKLIGIASFAVQPALKQRHRGEMWGVYVDPAGRGLGIGRQLVQRVIDHAAAHVLVLEAGVRVGNDTAAALYESLGFRVSGLHPKALCVDGLFYDEHLLVMEFPPAGSAGDAAA